MGRPGLRDHRRAGDGCGPGRPPRQRRQTNLVGEQCSAAAAQPEPFGQRLPITQRGEHQPGELEPSEPFRLACHQRQPHGHAVRLADQQPEPQSDLESEPQLDLEPERQSDRDGEPRTLGFLAVLDDIEQDDGAVAGDDVVPRDLQFSHDLRLPDDRELDGVGQSQLPDPHAVFQEGKDERLDEV